EDFDFNNFENSTDESSNNEQDTSELKKPEYNRFDKKNLKWNPNWKKIYLWVDLVL
ncbi:4277_t:CDS:1, partial [Cetraspora pellucida]